MHKNHTDKKSKITIINRIIKAWASKWIKVDKSNSLKMQTNE